MTYEAGPAGPRRRATVPLVPGTCDLLNVCKGLFLHRRTPQGSPTTEAGKWAGELRSGAGTASGPGVICGSGHQGRTQGRVSAYRIHGRTVNPSLRWKRLGVARRRAGDYRGAFETPIQAGATGVLLGTLALWTLPPKP